MSRQVVGNIVSDLDLIERTFPEGVDSIEMLCVDEVVDGRTLRATFATGEKQLFANPSNAS
jgi:putative hydrolase of HD superfamily